MQKKFKIFSYKFFFLMLLLRKLGFAYQPKFSEPLGNITIPIGRDVTFRCYVDHLGGYRIGWVKADTKAIQAIHDHVITHNPRVSVTHTDHTTWNLHIRNVQEEDRGLYMCQINTDPMKSQLGYLEVVVPPDFIFEETSMDTEVPEGGSVKLTCRAKGHPKPRVQWRRENGAEIIVKEPPGYRTKVTSYAGEHLKLMKISRSEMGPYLCIASNGVPPSISKRIMVTVNFHPVIQVPNQLVGAPLGTDVTLECFVEASPRSINYWVRDPDGMVIPSKKYDVRVITSSLFEAKMIVVIRNLEKEDMGTYKCIAKNSLGEVESNIRVYEKDNLAGRISEIAGPTKFPPTDEDDHAGSAERHDGTRIKGRGKGPFRDLKNPNRGNKTRKPDNNSGVPTTAIAKSSSFQCTVSYEILYPFMIFFQMVINLFI